MVAIHGPFEAEVDVLGSRGLPQGVVWSRLPEAGFSTGGECSVSGQARGGLWD